MEKVFYIKDSVGNKISYYHLLFFLFALPFDRFYSTVILISFIIHSAIFYYKNQLKNIIRSTVILQSVFFVTVVSALYAPSFDDSLNVIMKQLAVLIFPVLFAINSLDLVKYRSQLMHGLGLCCTLTILYLYFESVHLILVSKLPLKTLLSAAFVNHNFSLPIDMHATYLSMLVVLSIVYFLQQLFYKPAAYLRIYAITNLFILFAGLIQLGSKSAFIALLIIVIFGFPWFLIRKEARYRFVFFSLAALVLLITFILSFQVFRERYLISLRDDLYENRTIVQMNGRFDRWTAAVDLIKKYPYFGTGAGSEIPLLRESYFDRKMYGSYLGSLNAHNQYLSFMINSGLTGLAIYLATLAWGLRISVIKRDLMLFCFIVLITIVSLSEDLLDVNKGIYFYAFFFPFLIRSGREPAS